jgi:hypothetical protein
LMVVFFFEPILHPHDGTWDWIKGFAYDLPLS